MRPDKLERAKELFFESLKSAASGRAEFVERACAGDRELLQEVQDLLNWHNGSDDLLDRPAAESIGLALSSQDIELPRTIAASLAPGLTLKKRYVIQEQLAVGGIATVYLARDAFRAGKLVVVKVFHHRAAAAAVDMLRAELETLARLNHPAIVDVVDIGELVDGSLFLVTAYASGQTLRAILKSGKMPTGQALVIAIRVAETISAAHAEGIWHLDLKPENLIVSSTGTGVHVVVIDFGAAALRRIGGWISASAGYAAPEQIAGGACAQSDVYSLAVILHELLTGRFPAAGGIAATPNTLPSVLPPSICKILARALDAAPDRRIQTMKEFRDELLRATTELRRQEHLNPSTGALSSVSQNASLAAIEHLEMPPSLPNEQLPSSSATLNGHDADTRNLPHQAGRKITRNRVVIAAGTLLMVILAWTGLSALFTARRSQRSLAYTLELSANHIALIEGNPILTKTTIRDLQVEKRVLLALAREHFDKEPILSQVVDLLHVLGTIEAHPASLNMADTAGALETYQEGARLIDSLYERKPDRADYAQRYSILHCALGTILIEMNRYPDALRQFVAAASVNAHVAGSDEAADNRRLAYADAIANISRVRLHEQNEEECLRLRAESVRIRKDILRRRDRWSYLLDVSGSLATYGWALRNFGRYEQALAVYLESTALLDEGIAMGDKGLLRLLSIKAKNGEQLARILVAMNRRIAARQRIEESVAVYRRILSIQPKSASDRRGLALSLGVLAEIEAARGGSSEQCSNTVLEALQLSEQAILDDRQNAKVREEGADLEAVARRLGCASR
ncbi:MAG TPA: serine/threonine-protein kinase [Bryobacteraceae bacterium]|jgi:serine/threonine protein kinase|nr:serine/threonine-protein kinase [Bryobacteraceae bacterium]